MNVEAEINRTATKPNHLIGCATDRPVVETWEVQIGEAVFVLEFAPTRDTRITPEIVWDTFISSRADRRANRREVAG